ncbi:elongation factor tu family protein [Tieghemostelium lacteum]|uniref:Elongation factor tu family protein n=1 Tax=Tieghemostelium lacteum TaxID=361077 RepID=A0A151ZA38_TIELA|nr:elongation factor tu family protein [Tieghemostelium lacteum]|eukprot:KYQ90744.1 elongation factor tu family protein [Tieghemostelium lacteum]
MISIQKIIGNQKLVQSVVSNSLKSINAIRSVPVNGSQKNSTSTPVLNRLNLTNKNNQRNLVYSYNELLNSHIVSGYNNYVMGGRRNYSTNNEKIRNVAIIAHVDHGKTSLVDQLLRQSGALKDVKDERVMDSNQLEKERGITIMAKCTSFTFNGYKLNIVDTPGHGDFGGEVERVLSMVDGVVLLVDATEGPMAQTKFVLSKALQAGLRPIVVINKMDRNTARVDEVENEIFDLFATLDANDDQLNYPTLYASGRQGWAVKQRNDDQKNIHPLLETIIDYVKAPQVKADEPFSMLVTNLESDPFVGRIVTGKIYSGRVKIGQPLKVMDIDGNILESSKVTKIFARKGIERVILEEGEAGDIIGIAGFPNATVTNSVIAPEGIDKPIKANPIDPPVISMHFEVNTSPFSGKEGTQLTALKIKNRLLKELESNVSLHVNVSGETFEVKGRGELQLGILLENMRREGFELAVSQPKVVFQKDEAGHTMEPQEEVIIDVDTEYSGAIIEKLSKRKGDIIEMKQGMGKSRLVFMVPSRGLIGLRSELINDTKGTGVMNHLFHSYVPHKGPMDNREKGALISMMEGQTTAYALSSLEDRGTLFVGPQTPVYSGMIVGENSKQNDLDVNPVKAKQLTNIRTVSKEEGIRLQPPKILKLEEAIASVKEDELIEITPKSIRLRKRELDMTKRQKIARDKKSEYNA